MSKSATVRWLALFALFTVCAEPQAVAKPLGSETCKVLKAEHATLRKQGVISTMKNGPTWAKANLAEEELGRIKRYLMLQDHIKFRCFKGQKKILPDSVAKTAKKWPPKEVPLPLKKERVKKPIEPAELDMEAIRDSLHGYQDSDPADTAPKAGSPRGQRSGDNKPADVTGAITPKQGPTANSPSHEALLATQPQTRPLTYSIRQLTSEDLAASAGVEPAAQPTQQIKTRFRRRVSKEKKSDWYSFGIDRPLN
jgi:hypothetical protein